MKQKYFAIVADPRTQVVWASDCMESVKRHAVEETELTGIIYGWSALDDDCFSTPSAYIVSGRRVVASYYFRRGWQRENGPASIGQMDAIKKYLTPAERPETISAGTTAPEPIPETAPAAAAEPAQEAAPAAAAEPIPETITLAPEAFRSAVEAAPRCGLLIDIQGDALRYKTMEGRPRCIYYESITADNNVARIRYFNGGNRGQIALDKKHDCFPVAAVVAGSVMASDALYDIESSAARIREKLNKDKKEILSSRKPSGQRKEEAKEKIQRAAVLADQTACIIKNCPGGIPLFVSVIARELEAVAAVAKELNQAISAAKHIEAVAAWIRDIDSACREAWEKSAAQRPETILTGNQAPEAQEAAPAAAAEPVQEDAQENKDSTIILVEKTFDITNGGSSSRRIQYNASTGKMETLPEKMEAAPAAAEPAPEPEPAAAAEAPEPAAAAEPVPEARPRRTAPEKPARGPGKPLDFIGQVLSGNGWQIVFDTGLQRTRVIISEAAREKAAPLAEAAGFYYSANTDSWHKKLSHKAHRAAEALAEKLRAAC